MTSNTTWMVRAGEGAFLAEEFLDKGIVSIGWKHLGDLTTVKDVNGLRDLYKKTYPGHKPGKVNLTVGQIFRFKSEFKIGDQVVTYNAQDRHYSLGVIDSDYEYHPENELHPHWRKVKWLKKVDRDGLSTTTKNALGSIMTIFLIDKNAADELNGKLPVQRVEELPVEEKETLDTIKEEIEEKAHEFIKDKTGKSCRIL